MSDSSPPSVLQLTMRRVADLVAYCILYEFEDVTRALTGADRVDVIDISRINRSRRIYRYLRLLSGSPKLAKSLSPENHAKDATREYDLFLPTFNDIGELYSVNAIPDWKKRCRIKACFINEMWAPPGPEYLLELLADFDHVFVGSGHVAPSLAKAIGKPVTYLPMATNVLRFSPNSPEAPRPFDVCNVGRRSPITHAALIKLASTRAISYYYDTFASGRGKYANQRTFYVEDPVEHRMLLSNILRQSRFYVANRGRINEPAFTRGQEEISGRFYEGSAAGCVLIGEPPRTDIFRANFDWEDVVIHMPFDSPNVADLLADLNSDPARLERIRRTNVTQAALRHDWLYRLQVIFRSLGLPPTEAMQQRAEQLQRVAAASCYVD